MYHAEMNVGRIGEMCTHFIVKSIIVILQYLQTIYILLGAIITPTDYTRNERLLFFIPIYTSGTL